jgi:hypothetical protein
MILSTGETFAIDVAWLLGGGPRDARSRRALPQTLQGQERELIEAALARSHGKVAGARGAAAQLGIPASALESKFGSSRLRSGGSRSFHLISDVPSVGPSTISLCAEHRCGIPCCRTSCR